MLDIPPLGYLLKDAQALLHTRMEEGLRPLGLGVSQYVALHLMHAEPGISASVLARRAFVTRQSMSSIVVGLQERGLVEREAGGTGRALSTRITGIGRDVLRRSEVVVERVESRMLAGLDSSERDALRFALTRCIDALASAR